MHRAPLTGIVDKQRYMNAHRKTEEGKSSRDAERRVIYGLQLFQFMTNFTSSISEVYLDKIIAL
jgi:hypothetical protein